MHAGEWGLCHNCSIVARTASIIRALFIANVSRGYDCIKYNTVTYVWKYLVIAVWLAGSTSIPMNCNAPRTHDLSIHLTCVFDLRLFVDTNVYYFHFPGGLLACLLGCLFVCLLLYPCAIFHLYIYTNTYSFTHLSGSTNSYLRLGACSAESRLFNSFCTHYNNAWWAENVSHLCYIHYLAYT